MKPLPVNFNVQVTVTLTDYGMECRRTFYERYPSDYRPKEARTITTELWTLARIFGPGMYNGMPETPFVNNTLTLHLEDQ